jgi:hypothetical protein
MLHSDEDYIFNRRYGYSIKKLLERYPDGTPDYIIAQSLMISEEDLEEEYLKLAQKLKQLMKVE